MSPRPSTGSCSDATARDPAGPAARRHGDALSYPRRARAHRPGAAGAADGGAMTPRRSTSTWPRQRRWTWRARASAPRAGGRPLRHAPRMSPDVERRPQDDPGRSRPASRLATDLATGAVPDLLSGAVDDSELDGWLRGAPADTGSVKLSDDDEPELSAGASRRDGGCSGGGQSPRTSRYDAAGCCVRAGSSLWSLSWPRSPPGSSAGSSRVGTCRFRR